MFASGLFDEPKEDQDSTRESVGEPDHGPTPSMSPEETLARCIQTFRRWLHMPDAGALCVTLAAVAANRSIGDPIWLLVVGPPGGGKTELIQAIARQPDAYSAATLTEGSLLSGVPSRDRAKGAKGGLLREIGAFGILLHKDFGSILSMNRDARGQVLAALREIYDGSWTRHIGSDGGRTLTWSGKVGLIAGCTPSVDSHHAVMGAMGERFIMYRMPEVDGDAQARQALLHIGREATMRHELAAAVDRVLAAVATDLLSAPPTQEAENRLTSLATLAVRCRSAVERDPHTREIALLPEPEAPARLVLVLLRLLNGLRGIGTPDEAAWSFVGKCALDSMPAVRRTMLEDLCRVGGETSTTEVSLRTNYPPTTVRRALEELAAYEVVERTAAGTGRADVWRVSPWTLERLRSVPELSGRIGDSADRPAQTA